MSYAEDGDFPGFSDLEQLPAGRRPAVFMFQTNGFDPVTPDRLLEWEQTLVERYDLPRLNFNDEEVLRSATWSNSGGRGEICADDSDLQGFADDGGGTPSDDRQPAIFMWQPSRFHAVPAERLAEWERLLRTRVGLPAAGIAADDFGIATLSATLPNDCMDDSDHASQ